jgi:hypothetical protein
LGRGGMFPMANGVPTASRLKAVLMGVRIKSRWLQVTRNQPYTDLRSAHLVRS